MWYLESIEGYIYAINQIDILEAGGKEDEETSVYRYDFDPWMCKSLLCAL